MPRYVPAVRLTAVAPEALAGLLLAAGRRERQGKPGVFRVLVGPDGETDVPIPANTGWADYRSRLDEALAGAAESLGAGAQDFMRALLGAPAGDLAGPAARTGIPAPEHAPHQRALEGTGAHSS
jgi:hypothetical protein